MRLKTQDPTRIKGPGEAAILSLDKDSQKVLRLFGVALHGKGCSPSHFTTHYFLLDGQLKLILNYNTV